MKKQLWYTDVHIIVSDILVAYTWLASDMIKRKTIIANASTSVTIGP